MFRPRFYRFYRALKKRFPLQTPVNLRTRPLKERLGSAAHYTDRQGHMIYISSRCTYEQAIDVLLHEYAHCIDFEFNPTRVVEHNAFWGIKYGELYRFWERFEFIE
jgi:hypothetical protein